MLSKLKLNQLYFKDTSFVNLMTKRILMFFGSKSV